MSAVVVGYARTPFVKFAGRFAEVPATALGAHAIAAALERAGVAPGEVDQVVGGQVLQGGAGQNPARQSAAGAGIPLDVPAITLNAVCLSGTEAVVQAARLIASGEAQIVVAVGQESMSLAPHAWPGSRAGRRYGSIELLDTLEHDGLTDAFEKRSMGASTESFNAPLGLTREEQDAWAAASHTRLAGSLEFQAGEIAAFEVPGRRGPTVVSDDDGLRADTTPESLGALRPAFGGSGGAGAGGAGTITAGNSSQITDGAAAIVLMSEELAAARAAHPLTRVLAHAFVAGPDVSLHAQPANAITAALAKAGRSTGELAAVEINEAFAAVAVHSTRALGVDDAIVNAHGGAIALGHPIGASGTRIVGTLARRLAAAGPGALGAAGICGGGGQGSAVVLEAL
ncbi:acetyl-CoA C-acyltransferase [Herbiconiux sp. CPCC 203407]|uniref:Probable acetyl-CoA acetyltransferase n=1 Tax=Herbiconiux oxytropis TaxID=2970915 RepID=A0AA42BUB4_9MICO|nr:acetyl-CoA C-acyltransferase [Herbiconiux oxytropis]MCS5721646.1 acetyl-CoA C-acyltransferase [Herbiconiux oxytropis]MCS5726727.1 acetyl-CoA C-acyltransferase [Herbiconiux oxytropis]